METEIDNEPERVAVTYEVTVIVDEDTPSPTEGDIEEALQGRGYLSVEAQRL